MTDRIYALTVYLEQPTRDDDVQSLITAIRQLRGVGKVQPHIARPEQDVGGYAEWHAKQELIKKLWDVLKDE